MLLHGLAAARGQSLPVTFRALRDHWRACGTTVWSFPSLPQWRKSDQRKAVKIGPFAPAEPRARWPLDGGRLGAARWARRKRRRASHILSGADDWVGLAALASRDHWFPAHPQRARAGRVTGSFGQFLRLLPARYLQELLYFARIDSPTCRC